MPSISSALLLSLASIVALPAWAADPPPKSGPVLTKEQLRTCMSRQAAMKQTDIDLAKEQAEVAQMKADLATGKQQLDAQLAGLDRSKQSAVEAYNAAGKARDQQLETYQTRATAFNDHVDARDAERASYGPACVNRRYMEEDAAALKAGK